MIKHRCPIPLNYKDLITSYRKNGELSDEQAEGIVQMIEQSEATGEANIPPTPFLDKVFSFFRR